MQFSFSNATASRRHFSPLGALFALALAMNFGPFALGQSFTSSITGTVTDPSGAAVNAAQVHLTNMGTNDVREVATQSAGTYQFNNLGPGTYQVSVTASGFKTYVKSNLILEAQIATTINIPLEVGSTQQTVDVQGSTVLVDTQTANTSITLDRQLIEALPNSTRNPLNFVFAIAGTTEAPGGQTQKSGSLDQMSSNFGINGGRTGEASILIDGAPSQAVDWGGLVVSPLQDSVEEQQIVSNTYDAQYERGGAGIVTLITKGGTTAFHGEAYDYLQNSVLNANGWTNNENGAPRGQFKQNQFGGNISGPILKRWNLFFFGGYEGFRSPNTQNTGLLTVPTQAQRNGDFSQTFNADGSPDLIYNPFNTTALDSTGNNYTRTQFPNNTIPTSLINPVGQKMVNLYPLPNRPGVGPNNLSNYYAQGSGNTLNDKMDTRFDWDQSTNHRIFVRWSDRFRQDQTVPCYFCNGADTGNNQANTGFQVVLNDTITPSPTWVINTYVSYSRWQEKHTAQGFGVASASTVGLSPSLFQAPLLPTISADNGYTGLGNGSYQVYTRYSDTAQVNLTKQAGAHTVKFGANFDLQQINSISEAPGSFSFSNAQTSCDPQTDQNGSLIGGPCLAVNHTAATSGNSIASMLLGAASGGGQSTNIDPAMAMHTYGTYIQDQWRLTQRLTLNFGIRYENQRPATERFNRLMYFDSSALNPISAAVAPALGRQITGAFEYASGNSRYAWPPQNLDFAPRAGIAFKITDRFVMRAGAGIFYLPTSAMISYDNPGQFYGFSSSTPYIATTNNGYTPLNLVNSPFPNGLNAPQGSSQGALTLVGNGEGQIWPVAPHPTPYSESWNFDLQYQVSAHSVFQIGYIGNRGRKLLYGNPSLDADQLPDQYLSLGAKLDSQVTNPFYNVAPAGTYLASQPTVAYNELLRPYPQYTYLQWTRSLPGARSSYNALNVKYNHSFNSGLSLLMTYAWSKALDNGPEDFFGWATGTQWRDYYNTKLDYNISTHDVPQSFATAVVYELPYGRGKHWGSGAPAFVKQTLGNWQLSSTIRLASGLPLYGLQNSNSNQLNNYGFPGPQLPDLISKNVVPTHQTPDSWVNASAYATPASIYMLGNAPQRMTQLRERAARNVDLSISKRFGTERFGATLRGEAINAFNYAQYNNVCLDLSGQNCVFGKAYGTENQPRLFQLSLKLAF